MKSLAQLVAWLLLASSVVRAELSPEELFRLKVQPLLESRCVSCHGPEKQKSGLRLDSRAALLKGGENGPAVVPGDPSKSLLLQAVLHLKADLGMPPKERLSKVETGYLERWIREGVVWVQPTPVAAATAKSGDRIGDCWSDPRNPIVRIFGGQRLDLWSLKRPEAPPLPTVKDRAWGRNAIDRFVLARLEMNRLRPAPEASRRTLARRLFLDLTGLPPSPSEVQAFVEDRRPDAYERLVDALLASRAYGEHQARGWLDVIRYSDSNGFDWDEFRPRAWRFRDYVVRSFNADKPFDQFVREQLAGDELLPGPPRDLAEQDALIATGYLRLGPHDNSAGSFNEQDRSRAELMSDLTETTGSAFLGLTMACNRCHDHKFDPLSQADHYRLRAFFEPVKFADDLPLDLAAQQSLVQSRNKELDDLIKPLKEEQDGILGAARKRLKDQRLAALSEEERLLVQSTNRPPDLKGRIEGIEKKIQPSDKEVKAALSDEPKRLFEDLARRVQEFEKEKIPLTLGLLMTDNKEKVNPTRILFQGNHKEPRAEVQAGFISALDPNPAALLPPANPRTTGRRLTLAEWIVSPENPLTARVLVNRVWQSLFGQGLVATPNDLGLAGSRPTHPELLDHLALELLRQGWSIKKLQRSIVLSATYRQSSVHPDPAGALALDRDNQLLWRQNLRRLSAESIRDSTLAVSGLLKERVGGPPIWPDLPAEVLQANPAFLDDNPEKTKGWYPSPKPDQSVRGLYLVQKRTVRVPFMETFDLPDNSVSCPRRALSIVAPQALSLLNGPDTIAAAESLARRVQAAQPESDHGGMVEQAFAFALQRKPTSAEFKACEHFLQERTLPELCRAVLNLNEFVFRD